MSIIILNLKLLILLMLNKLSKVKYEKLKQETNHRTIQQKAYYCAVLLCCLHIQTHYYLN